MEIIPLKQKPSGGKKMKTFASLTLIIVLTASLLVGCGCTNQNMDNTSAPTILPTNEEIWNSTESTTRNTTEATTMTETTNPSTTADTTEETRNINETEVQNRVNAHTDMMDKIREQEKANKATENNTSRMMPGTR